MPVLLSRCELAQRCQESFHFFSGVVVHQPNAQDAAFLLDTEALGQIQGVEISVPGENSAVTEKRCDFGWMVIAQPEG